MVRTVHVLSLGGSRLSKKGRPRPKSQRQRAGIEIAFKHGVQRLPKTKLDKYARLFELPTRTLITREHYVTALINSQNQRLKLALLQKQLLAGRTSVHVYGMPEDTASDFRIRPDFTEPSRDPAIVHVGELGEIFTGLRHILWALIVGETHYIDKELELVSDGKVLLVDSFFDPTKHILQVRTGAQPAKAIGLHWAKLARIDFDKQISRIGLSDPTQFHEFAKLVKGKIYACHGEKLISEGFGDIRGKRHPSVDDLLDTDDYKTYLSEVDAIDADLEVEYERAIYRVGFGFKTRSVVFRTTATEGVIRHIYQQLIKFWFDI